MNKTHTSVTAGAWPGAGELVLIAVVVLAGLGVRAWRLADVGIDHFDEAVYAFSALGLTQAGEPHVFYPGQQNFSPPVFPFLVGVSYLLYGAPSAAAGITVNVILGTLTIAALWWIGRTWFDARVGLAAATLLAFNQFHIAFSRTVLTDVAFVLLFLVALLLIGAAVERRSIGWGAAAGVAVGLAWNTKYHGWFAAALAAAAALPFAWWQCRERRSLASLLAVLGVVAAVAALCYLPWAYYVERQPGGYAALVKVHRAMTNLDVLRNLMRQAQAQIYFDGPLTRAAIPLALGVATLAGAGGRGGTRRFELVLVALSLGAVVAGGAVCGVVLAAGALPVLFRQLTRFPVWLLIGSLGLWITSLPLYHPYARLALPLMVTIDLCAAVAIVELLRQLDRPSSSRVRQPVAAAVAAGIVAVVPPALANNRAPWNEGHGFAQAASALEKVIPAGTPVAVVAEPALAFYLHLAGRPAFERYDVGSIKASATPLYVVTGLYAQRAPQVRQEIEALGGRLEKIGTFPVTPRDIRLMDDFPPARVRAEGAGLADAYTLTLHRLTPRITQP